LPRPRPHPDHGAAHGLAAAVLGQRAVQPIHVPTSGRTRGDEKPPSARGVRQGSARGPPAGHGKMMNQRRRGVCRGNAPDLRLGMRRRQTWSHCCPRYRAPLQVVKRQVVGLGALPDEKLRQARRSAAATPQQERTLTTAAGHVGARPGRSHGWGVLGWGKIVLETAAPCRSPTPHGVASSSAADLERAPLESAASSPNTTSPRDPIARRRRPEHHARIAGEAHEALELAREEIKPSG
jgi:hypothetical protein